MIDIHVPTFISPERELPLKGLPRKWRNHNLHNGEQKLDDHCVHFLRQAVHGAAYQNWGIPNECVS